MKNNQRQVPIEELDTQSEMSNTLNKRVIEELKWYTKE